MAALTMIYKQGLVHNKPLAAPVSVKLVYYISALETFF